jgi:PDZ domain-containing protein
MSRRGLTFGLAAFLIAALGLLATQLPVPYVVLVPGPVTDTLHEVPGTGGTTGRPAVPVVSVTGARTYPVTGHLYLTTVGIEPGDCSENPTLWQAIRAWFDSTNSVQPKQVECPPGQPATAVKQQEVQDMTDSQRDAVTAALLHLHYKPVHQDVVVATTTPGTPAERALRVGDVFSAVDGTTVTSPAQLRSLISAHPVGTSLTLTVRRGGRPQQVKVRSIQDPASHRPIIGVTLDLRATFAKPRVRIGIDPNAVGGPSAGLAFTLGIIDKLTPGGITGGRTIAGTGTIDGFGVVGAIGGIQQKIAAAVKAGATVFFAPAADCPDAKGAAPSSLTLVRVTTLDSAVNALHAITSGHGTFPRC